MKFGALYVATLGTLVGGIELLKAGVDPEPQVQEQPVAEVMAVPPKPEGASPDQAGDGPSVRYTEEQCAAQQGDYREACFHALALQRAERDPDRILVGINNRDLRTFDVTLDVTLRTLDELPEGLHVVSESGIHSAAAARRLRDAGARAILVGESLMRAEDVEDAARTLMSAVRESA